MRRLLYLRIFALKLLEGILLNFVSLLSYFGTVTDQFCALGSLVIVRFLKPDRLSYDHVLRASITGSTVRPLRRVSS